MFPEQVEMGAPTGTGLWNTEQNSSTYNLVAILFLFEKFSFEVKAHLSPLQRNLQGALWHFPVIRDCCALETLTLGFAGSADVVRGSQQTP